MKWRLIFLTCFAFTMHLAAEEEVLNVVQEEAQPELVAKEEAQIVQEAASTDVKEGFSEKLASRFWGF